MPDLMAAALMFLPWGAIALAQLKRRADAQRHR